MTVIVYHYTKIHACGLHTEEQDTFGKTFAACTLKTSTCYSGAAVETGLQQGRMMGTHKNTKAPFMLQL